MGCESAEVKDVKKENETKEIEVIKEEVKEEIKEEVKEVKDLKQGKKIIDNRLNEEMHNFDKETLDYFSNFTEKEISLILSRRKLINAKNNFCFLYDKYELIYNDKFLSKSNKILCTEFLAFYINPNYIGNFGYESQIIGFFPKDVILKECYIKGKKIPSRLINNGRIISLLKIEEEHKKNIMDDIIVIEFIYNITQIKNYGMRLINIDYKEDLLTCSMKIKYSENKLSIKSNDDSASFNKNEFYIFNKNKFCLTLIDKNYIISLNDEKNKINKFINEKLSSEEIQEINNCLKEINIKPLKPNLIYEKLKIELHEEKDYIEGSLLIFQPSFEKYYFDLFDIIKTNQNDIIVKLCELKINNNTIINLNSSKTYNSKSYDYYKSSNNSQYYNISTKEDFNLFEFQLEVFGTNSENKKRKYNFDPKNIFKLYFSKGSYYYFEIILNSIKVSFENKENYKYKKEDDKIIFEGKWELDDFDENKNDQSLPKDIIMKIN